jgi:hypothetical protein
MTKTIIAEKASQARDIRAAIGDRHGQVLPTEPGRPRARLLMPDAARRACGPAAAGEPAPRLKLPGLVNSPISRPSGVLLYPFRPDKLFLPSCHITI